MTDNPNRCQYCWSSLPAARPEVCPHCHRILAVKASRRRWRTQADEVAAAPAAPAPARDRTPEPYAAPEPPASTPYEPPASYPPPATAPAPAAVAVLERDAGEFPGQPLPPDFFAALPERTRRAPRKLNLRVLIVVAVVGGGALFSAIGDRADRTAAVDSPARYLVAGACAEYRDITTRMERNPNDVAAVQEGMVWLENNVDRFVEAARLDPDLKGAADYVVWWNAMITGDAQSFADLSRDEITNREEPLAQACYSGPGRA